MPAVDRVPVADLGVVLRFEDAWEGNEGVLPGRRGGKERAPGDDGDDGRDHDVVAVPAVVRDLLLLRFRRRDNVLCGTLRAGCARGREAVADGAAAHGQ